MVSDLQRMEDAVARLSAAQEQLTRSRRLSPTLTSFSPAAASRARSPSLRHHICRREMVC